MLGISGLDLALGSEQDARPPLPKLSWVWIELYFMCGSLEASKHMPQLSSEKSR